MKKQLLFILLSGLAVATMAQSFTVSGPRTIFELNTTNKGTKKYTFFNFEQGREISPSDSATSKWDIAFSGTTIILNGGTSGPSTVSGQVLSGTSFIDVESAPTTSYVVDGSTKAIPTGSNNGWYKYNGQGATGPHTVTPIADRVIAIKLADGRYVKLEILNYYQGVPNNIPTTIGDPTYTGVGGYYSFRYLLGEQGSSDLSNVVTTISNLYANLPGGHYNFLNLASADTVVTADSNSTKWDIAFYSTNILVNGGTSGPGSEEIQMVVDQFGSYLTAPSTGWGTTLSGWYDYDMTNHVLTPKQGRVVLVKTSLGRYVKIKLNSYYKDGVTSNTSRYYSISYFFQPYQSTDLATPLVATSIFSGKETSTVFKVYPNPVAANQNVNIELANNTIAKVKISNLQGTEIGSYESTGFIENVHLLPGVYVLTIEADGKTAQQKLVVK